MGVGVWSRAVELYGRENPHQERLFVTTMDNGNDTDRLYGKIDSSRKKVQE